MRRIADYELVEQLGEGNYGTFWKARTPERLGIDDPWVAVKILDQNAGDEEFRRVVNELRVFASVDSPWLVPLYDAGHQRGTLYYAMRYHERGSLAQPRVVLGLTDRVRAVACAARGAHALHEVGVAHRDIKPGNILLGDDGTACLSDLGLAQLLAPGQTVTGTGPIGSIEYMEPGVMRGEKAGRASDIWSLGVTLHVVATGRPVFPGVPETNLLEALRHILGSEPRLDPALPGPLVAVVRRALAPTRADRFPTAEDMATAIEEALEALS